MKMNEAEQNKVSPSHKPEDSPREALLFSLRDWLCLILSLALALLFFKVFGLGEIAERGLPALGITVFVFSLFAAVILSLGRRVRLESSGCLLCLASLLLSLTFCLYSDWILRILNCFIILGLGAMGIFRISGRAEKSWRQVGALWETGKLSLLALFSHIDVPFRALSGLSRGKAGHMKGVGLGLLISLPVLTAVLMLLTSADEVFRGLLMGLGDWLAGLDAGRFLWRIFRTAALTLLLFSALFFLRQPRSETGKAAVSEREAGKIPCAPFVVVLSLLDLVYLVFVVIQFAFLFGGAEAAQMKGGWAEYARSGFFQLVGVSSINLCAVLTTAVFGTDRIKEPSGRRALLALSVLLLFFTAVILCSAFWRMRLYISVYGLSLLRALTLWDMAFLAISLAAAALRLFLSGFRFFPVFFAAGLVLWLAFSFVNIDRRIADYNVDAWLSGRVEHMDTDYLKQLGPDTLPALRRLNAADSASFSDDSLREFENAIEAQRERAGWREWNLSLLRGGGEY